jgi:hypothetical protein
MGKQGHMKHLVVKCTFCSNEYEDKVDGPEPVGWEGVGTMSPVCPDCVMQMAVGAILGGEAAEAVGGRLEYLRLSRPPTE